MAGVAYNQIKDGGVYTICNFVSSGNARNYISYDGTSITYGAAPSTAKYGYWIAHKLSGDKYYFESNQTPGVYLSGQDVSGKTTTIAVATGSVFTLSQGTADASAYVSMYTAIKSVNADKFMAGYSNPSSGFGSNCYASGKTQYESLFSTDWEFTEIGFDKQYFKDKVNFYSTNFNKLYSSADKETAIAAIEASTTLEQVYTALDAFCRTAEDKVFTFSTGAVGNRRYIQQTAATVISFTEIANDNCRFQLVYAGSGAYYVKSQANNWYWGYLNNRGGQLGGTADTQWAGKWILGKANTANSTGDIITMFCQNSNVIYYYIHAANASLLTDWNDTDASKWTMDVIEENPWTVIITGGTATDRVIFADDEYADGSQIAAYAITPTDVKTNINDRFVWGPIIDSENRTVTFEVRSTQEGSITAGKFYQIQLKDEVGTVVRSGNSWTLGVSMAQEVSTWPMRYPGSQIYMTGYTTNQWCVSLTGIPNAENVYETFLYVPSGTTALQMRNGGYIGNNSQYSSGLSNLSLAYNSGNHSFTWNNNVFPWYGLESSKAGVGQGSGYGSGHIKLFFHPVTTGEDYDIYKVITAGEVECTNVNLVTTITNAGGTFFFLQKGTVVTAGDFLINGSEPTAITTNTVNGYIELSMIERPHVVHDIATLASITDMYGYYKLIADVNEPSQIATDFHGELDGNYHKIKGVTSALFANLVNATVKNVILEDVTISGGDIVGAIANTATGNSRIYNCGILATSAKNVVHDQQFTSTSTISGTTAGSIVGKIEGNARVVNCYSYADVNGTNAGGIVGDWAGTWYNGTSGLMVANCMYYGNLTGTNRSPIVYGGSDINTNYSIYSYFRWKSMSTTNFTRQNGALAATEDIWLDRFKFFQAGVTNHRDIAAYYVFGDASRISEMAQWYVDETIAPWPILRKAEKQTTILTKATQVLSSSAADKDPNTGAIITDVKNDITKRYDKMPGTNGRLTVNFTINGSNYSKELPITDMDDKHYDYTWGKVVLPFANEFEGWTMPTSSDVKCGKICIGWKITAVTGGNASSIDDYNFADRNNTNKDLYSESHYIFAQGGNYIVPYGVTAINVEAHFADAYYLADATYDVNHGGSRPTTYNGKTVYTSVAAAWTAMSDNTMPHDQAIVLVGNYHYSSSNSWNYTTKGCTIMSIDEDGDQQPDYGWYSNSTARQSWPAIRWDFITIPGFGMLQKGLDMPGLNIPTATGWFEITETCLCRTFEFEISDSKMTRTLAQAGNTNAYIIKGGWFQQLVRCYTEYGSSKNDKLSYVNVGGNAYIKEVFLGNHSNKSDTYTLRPVNVTGGEIEQCYMTGMRNNNYIVPEDNNVRFYCSGGKIGKYLSVYQAYPVVDATMKVDHARIGRFFGGGTTPKAQLSGNINITINYSDVDFFCGGPEFGDMSKGKSVTVNTTGSTYGEYYGAGFGGTALTRARNGEANSSSGIDNYASIRLGYNGDSGGFAVSYEMEALIDYQGRSLYRFYDNRAALSKATTGSVMTTATNCLFRNHFFGGGCQGKVDGDVTSILNNCVVNGSAYGGGYKAAATTINVYPASGHTWQQWDSTYKAFTAPYYPAPESYTWVHGTVGTKDDGNKILYTSEDLSDLGVVTGNTTLTIKGSDSVVTGDVFGGGAESKVLGNSTVIIGEQP